MIAHDDNSKQTNQSSTEWTEKYGTGRTSPARHMYSAYRCSRKWPGWGTAMMTSTYSDMRDRQEGEMDNPGPLLLELQAIQDAIRTIEDTPWITSARIYTSALEAVKHLKSQENAPYKQKHPWDSRKATYTEPDTLDRMTQYKQEQPLSRLTSTWAPNSLCIIDHTFPASFFHHVAADISSQKCAHVPWHLHVRTPYPVTYTR